MSVNPSTPFQRKAQWVGSPFENSVRMEPVDQVKVAVMSILIAPIRVILAFIVLAVAYFLAILTSASMDPNVEAPLTGWRRLVASFFVTSEEKSFIHKNFRMVRDMVANLIVLAHMVVGFCRVKVKGSRASAGEAPILVLAPHCSFFDALPFCWIGVPSVVGKKSLVKTPFVGRLLQLTVPIFVDRSSKDSRNLAMQKLKERAAKMINDSKRGVEWPQIAIFPEGTCTNRTQLISFKLGAFAMRLPVQPVCIKWPNKYDVISWTWEGNSVFELIWLALCQPRLYVEIEFLPVYVPNEAEKDDALLYAHNVRSIMANCLRVPTSDYSYEDAPYLSYGCRPRLNVFHRLAEQLNLSTTSIEELNQLKLKWTSLRSSDELRRCEYAVSIDTFISYLKLPSSRRPPELFRLFNMFDWQCRRRIDLREFLIVCCAGNDGMSKEFYTYCLSIFSRNEKEPISEVDFVKIVRLPKQMSVAEARMEYSSYIVSFPLQSSKGCFCYRCEDESRVYADGAIATSNQQQQSLPFVRQLGPILPLTFGRRRCVKAC
ncbi:1 acylglycerophosphocholine O acyltransferase [Trichuris trichiura]|uniref:1 acylglycerophosphocholine O acyltransferase n=1 Tax=Trichuris trichiura TaxID=36087 RepID=A0A077ZCL4_TRITR|nr:1 acylglycerophosphocholine O acyltransferase [Trichuris trichiura]